MKKIAALFFVGIFFTGSAQAGFVTHLDVTISAGPSGFTHYQYTLLNDKTSTFGVQNFSLSVAANAGLVNIQAPTGWKIDYNFGSMLLTCFVNNSNYYISPGESNKFSFDSLLLPTQQSYLIAGFDNSNQNYSSNAGFILSPGTTVAAPTSMIPLSFGVITLVGITAHRSKREE